jgi:hypothetical protein
MFESARLVISPASTATFQALFHAESHTFEEDINSIFTSLFFLHALHPDGAVLQKQPHPLGALASTSGETGKREFLR